MKPVSSPAELVEKVHAGLSPNTAVGPSPLGSGWVRVLATSWPYIGHSPPLAGVVHGADADAAGANQAAQSARPNSKAALRAIEVIRISSQPCLFSAEEQLMLRGPDLCVRRSTAVDRLPVVRNPASTTT